MGSKQKLVARGFYPKPRHGRIIEPFAGSARYSLLYPHNEVILFDANPVVVDVWRYLIKATKADILALPDIESKVSLDTVEGLTDAERHLIGFHLCRGKAKPRKVGHGQNSWNKDKLRIAELVGLVKHWQVFQQDAFGAPVWACDDLATWFIDPPYREAQTRAGNSDRYPYGDGLHYERLAEFVRTRNGLVIACEGIGADYLPFEFLTETTANSNNKSAKRAREYVYVQDNHKQIPIRSFQMKTEETGAATAVAEEEDNAQVWDVSKRDELMDLGFRVEQGASGFAAHELLGNRRVPETEGEYFSVLDTLVVAVRAEIQKTGMSSATLQGGDELDAVEDIIGEIDLSDSDDEQDPDEEELAPGQSLVKSTHKGPRLPGVYEIADPQLAEAAGEFLAAENEYKDANRRRKDALDALKAVAHLKEDLFKPDPENTGSIICRVGGMVIRLREETKEKVEVEEVGAE